MPRSAFGLRAPDRSAGLCRRDAHNLNGSFIDEIQELFRSHRSIAVLARFFNGWSLDFISHTVNSH